MNLDETYVAWSPDPPGNVVRKPRVVRVGIAPKRRRGGFTFTPIICTDERVQPLLPRFLVANRRVLSAAVLRRALPNKPANLHVWRESSGWSTSRLMCRMLGGLALTMAPLPQYQAILLFDCHGSHISPETVRCANRLGVWLCVVPAELTAAIQPLDRLAFSAFKIRLRQQYQQDLGAREMLPEQYLRRVFALSQSFFNAKRWKPGFASLGFEPHPVRLSRSLQGYEEALALVPASAPTREQIAQLFPRNYVFTDEIFDLWTCAARGPRARVRL